MITPKKVWYLSAVLILFNILFYWFLKEGMLLTIISDLLPVVCAIIAVLGMILAVRSFKSFDQTKLSWILLLSGMVLFCTAETIYAVLELALQVDVNEVFPTLADLFWMAGYLPLIAGLLLLLYGYKKSGLVFGRPWKYFFGLALVLILIIRLSYILFIPIVQDEELSWLAKLAYLYYPLGDIFLIIPAAILAYITSLFDKGRISRPWQFMTLGFLAMIIADILYSYLSWNNSYGPGNYIDVLFNLGYLLIGLSGIYQKQLIESV